MSESFAETVRRLREESGHGIYDCSRALKYTQGNYEKAKLYLRYMDYTRQAVVRSRTLNFEEWLKEPRP